MASLLLKSAVFLNLLLAEAAVVTTRNGSYSSLFLSNFKQDLFLGIPYAQPPVGDLRLRPPQPINSTFIGVRNATAYGYTCPGSDSATTYDLNEDCLTLNVVRPQLSNPNLHAKLPVLVYIYGGGFQTGATADPQYNMSFIVQASVDMGKPIIGASINYRKGTWGFLGGRDMVVRIPLQDLMIGTSAYLVIQILTSDRTLEI